YGDRSERGYQSRDGERRGYGNRDQGSRDGERRSYGDRSERGYQSRDGERRGYGNRDQGSRDGERRSYGDRSERGYQSRDGERRGYGNRDQGSRDGERRSYGDRDRGQRGERGGHGERSQRQGSSFERGGRDRDDHRGRRDEDNFVRPGLAAREDEPETPQDIDERSLPFGVRAELRGLPKELGSVVAAHLVAAGELIDDDPELAYRHAEAARRRAARLPVVREATAETAYAAGEFAVALNEYRALRRMTGGSEFLPVMADCERALGRPENALKLAREAADAGMDPDQQVEMLLVEAGSRDDMGNRAEALRLLKNGISQQTGSRLAQARLRYAYADLLERQGDTEAARKWFVTAGELDNEHTLDVDDRVNRLDGFVLEVGEDEPEEDEDGDLLPGGEGVHDDDEPADEDPAEGTDVPSGTPEPSAHPGQPPVEDAVQQDEATEQGSARRVEATVFSNAEDGQSEAQDEDLPAPDQEDER
ncbi:hypothetical protein, partial [Luteococcus peritonei]